MRTYPEKSNSSQTPSNISALRVIRIILTCIGAAALFYFAVILFVSIMVEKSWFLSGDARNFDPILGLNTVQQHAGKETQLLSIQASFVRSDGTLDLKADYLPSPNVIYNFIQEKSAPENAPPLGADASPEGIWHEPIRVTVSRPWQFFSVTRSSGSSNARYSYINLGMDTKVSPLEHSQQDIVEAPKCLFKNLWDQAKANGAPTDAVAIITYDARGYDFSIQNTPFHFQFDTDCRMIHSGG